MDAAEGRQGKPVGGTLSRLRYCAMLVLPILIFVPTAFGLHVVEDDYYYYERIARNILVGAGSTFDGVVRTNGYHPLWMACELIVIEAEHATRLPAQYWALALCCLLSILVLRRLRLKPESGLFAIAILLALTAYLAFFGATAMEASLLLFCAAAFFRQVQTRGYVLTPAGGALLALCFLARIDSLIYFAPLVAYFWLRTSGRDKLLGIAPLVVTVAAYVGLNQWYFLVPFPISGIAKSVRSITGLHPAVWKFLLQGAQDKLMIAVTILLSAWAARAGTLRDRMHLALSGTGVILYFVLTSLRSDWTIWQWYEFPFALHLMILATAEVPGRSQGRQPWIAWPATAAACLAVALVGFRNVVQARRETVMVTAAQTLKGFFADKPGAVVAMGDRAGAVGAALPNRLVQLEGLVMDRQFLDTMRRATSIMPVLDAYQVNYYVATNPRPEDKGCFRTLEPVQSAGFSIRLQSDICKPIALDFTTDGWRTVVFAVHPESTD